MKEFISDISTKKFSLADKVVGESIRPTLLNFIQKEYPDFCLSKSLSVSELNFFRGKYVSNYLIQEIGELGDLENTVLTSLENQSTITNKVTELDVVKPSFGQALADKVASFGGSWRFIVIFVTFMAFWILLNILFLVDKGFDPYPFILLNLILSCLAALQAPVIMMSQNRQEEIDRERERKDYMINLKSELELRMLHEKIDHLMLNQQQELIDLQKAQSEATNKIWTLLERTSK